MHLKQALDWKLLIGWFLRNDLRQIIEKRIGMEQYTDRLSQIAKHESYSRAAKKPQLAYRQPLEVIFDYEFTRLLKKLESMSGEYRKEEKGGRVGQGERWCGGGGGIKDEDEEGKYENEEEYDSIDVENVDPNVFLWKK